MRLRLTTPTSCVHCPIGKASGVGRGGLCPFEPRRYRAGALLASAGEPAQTVWYVKRGMVALSRRGVSGDEIGHLVVPAGGLVGFEALAMPSYGDTARAIGAATLCAASRSAVEAWLGPRGTPARVVLELLIESRVAAAPRAAGIDATAATRFARWLAEAANGETIPAIERRFVASVLGMTPETLSRVIGRMVAIGAIERQRRAFRIRDRERLARVARGEQDLHAVA